ncbi:MAG: helix-turn-helix transcriptional regulator [Desulfobacterales bacterium]|nr:helix-turn-helix transcriptional regulator [Desulfobacterales bacterium]
MWDGDKLRSLIKGRGLSVTSTAKDIGVSRTAVNDWINGTVPSGLHLVKLSQLLSIPPDHFFSVEPRNISVPLHRKKGAAKVREEYEKAALGLVGEYENMFRNAPPPGLEPSLRLASRQRQAQVALAQQLRKLSEIESDKPMDYRNLFDLLVRLRIVTIFRRFPTAVKGYAFYCCIHNHRVIFVNTSTNVLDLIFPVLHEIIHAIRSEKNQEAVYDDEEEAYCDTLAGLVQFPQQYVDMVITALTGKPKGAKVNTLKKYSSDYGHSLYGIAEQIRKSGSHVLSGIKEGGADTNLKKLFPTLEKILFDPPEPRPYIQKLRAFSPIFIDIVKDQIDTASRRKVGEWLGLDNIIDANGAIEEFSRLNQERL